MSIYENYCREEFDSQGRLTDISFHYPQNFNFGYDVVDAIAARTPEKRAMVWCNTEGGERFFTFSDISRMSNRIANVFRNAGIRLKRHYEYWFTAVALHKLGAVMVPVTHMLTVKDLLYRMGCMEVKGIVCTPLGGVPERML